MFVHVAVILVAIGIQIDIFLEQLHIKFKKSLAQVSLSSHCSFGFVMYLVSNILCIKEKKYLVMHFFNLNEYYIAPNNKLAALILQLEVFACLIMSFDRWASSTQHSVNDINF